jgi:hypothetical protein
MGRFEYKVTGGKLLSAETSTENSRITSVKITGDFFMHPEEAIEELENLIRGLSTTKTEETIMGFFEARPVELIGVSPKDFVHVLNMSLKADTP